MHPDQLTDSLRAAAGHALSTAFDRDVRVTGHQVLNATGHAYVTRLSLAGWPVDSAVLKLAHRDANGGFDPEDESDNTAALLWNEWAGLEFLTGLGVRAVPAFHAGDRERGFVVMEDIGDGSSLANVLLGSDPHRARIALEGYVDALAEIHLATFGRATEYAVARDRLGGELGFVMPLVPQSWPKLCGALAELDGAVTPTDAAHAAIERIDRMLADDAWQAYSPNDVCPDNNRLRDDGTVTLFDLEFGSFHHALRDVAYLLTTMPTCWCVRRTPEGLGAELVERYRQRLLAAGHDVLAEDFDRTLRFCQAYWAIWALAFHLGRAREPEGADRPRLEKWDFSLPSRRDLVGLRLDDLTDAARRLPELAPLERFAVDVRHTAERTWGGFTPVPLYPAFAGRRPTYTC